MGIPLPTRATGWGVRVVFRWSASLRVVSVVVRSIATTAQKVPTMVGTFGAMVAADRSDQICVQLDTFLRGGGYRPNVDGTTKSCLQLETNPLDGGLLLRCSMVATVFRGDRSDGPYLTRSPYHGRHFWRDGGYRPHDDRWDAKRCGPTENDPDPPPTDATAAVYPSPAHANFQLRLRGSGDMVSVANQLSSWWEFTNPTRWRQREG